MTMDRIGELERLQRLRDAGTLDDAQFEAEKARLLRPRRVSAPWVLGVAGAVAATAAIGWAVGTNVLQPAPAPTPSARPTPTPSPSPVATPVDRLAAAERAAFPAGRSLENEDGVRVLFAPGTLVDTPFGPVLVSQGRVPDASHADSGYVAVHYLRPTDDGYAVTRSFPEAVKSGSNGDMAEMAVSPKFGELPVIYAQGGGTWQGYTCGYTTLTELRPDGPAELISFMNLYEDSSRAGGESIEGKIADVVPNRSFTVRFSGSREFTNTYERRGGKYVLAAGEALEGC
jgi:hypothetical protein